MMHRRTILKAGAALAAAMFMGSSFGQAFPSKPIRLILPYAPTGLPDALSRAIADGLSAKIGQPVIIENMPGASGIIAASAAMKSEADGHTLLLVDNNIYGINPAVFERLPYDPLKDFQPITQAISGPMFLIANASLGVKTVKEFVAYAKAKPGLNYGSPGNATLHHLGMEEFAMRAGLKMTHIPYKGVVQAVPGLLTGDTAAMFTSIGSVLPHVQSGKLVVLAVGSSKRSSLVPNAPTLAESGYPFTVDTTMGFAVPAGTPRPVVDKLHQEFVAALKDPQVAERIRKLSMDIVANTPAQFEAQIRKDIEQYRELVKKTGLKVE